MSVWTGCKEFRTNLLWWAVVQTTVNFLVSRKAVIFGPGQVVFVFQERPLIPRAVYGGLKAGQRGAGHFTVDSGVAIRRF